MVPAWQADTVLYCRPYATSTCCRARPRPRRGCRRRRTSCGTSARADSHSDRRPDEHRPRRHRAGNCSVPATHHAWPRAGHHRPQRLCERECKPLAGHQYGRVVGLRIAAEFHAGPLRLDNGQRRAADPHCDHQRRRRRCPAIRGRTGARWARQGRLVVLEFTNFAITQQATTTTTTTTTHDRQPLRPHRRAPQSHRPAPQSHRPVPPRPRSRRPAGDRRVGRQCTHRPGGSRSGRLPAHRCPEVPRDVAGYSAHGAVRGWAPCSLAAATIRNGPLHLRPALAREASGLGGRGALRGREDRRHRPYGRRREHRVEACLVQRTGLSADHARSWLVEHDLPDPDGPTSTTTHGEGRRRASSSGTTARLRRADGGHRLRAKGALMKVEVS